MNLFKSSSCHLEIHQNQPNQWDNYTFYHCTSCPPVASSTICHGIHIRTATSTQSIGFWFSELLAIENPKKQIRSNRLAAYFWFNIRLLTDKRWAFSNPLQRLGYENWWTWEPGCGKKTKVINTTQLWFVLKQICILGWQHFGSKGHWIPTCHIESVHCQVFLVLKRQGHPILSKFSLPTNGYNFT